MRCHLFPCGGEPGRNRRVATEVSAVGGEGAGGDVVAVPVQVQVAVNDHVKVDVNAVSDVDVVFDLNLNLDLDRYPSGTMVQARGTQLPPGA